MQAMAFSGLASESQKTTSTSGPSPLALSSLAASSAPSRTSSPCGICSGPKTPILKVSPLPPPAPAEAPAEAPPVGAWAVPPPLSPQAASALMATTVQATAHFLLCMCSPSYSHGPW